MLNFGALVVWLNAVTSESLREGENGYFSHVNDPISARRGLKFIRAQAALSVQE